MNRLSKEQIDAMRQQRGPDYRPRTRHLDADGWAQYTNRLFLESSPYLLQHAHNPVNWYPWGEEAFETAKALDRPLLLSVGYSTCHWCHVMEEESFEDEEIARVINDNYIAVKVDREERPDVDAVYMAAVQALTGSGGWPMTVWLTSDRQPFYGGTYFPARDGDRGAAIGFRTLLIRLKQSYDTRKDIITTTSGQLVTAVQQMLAPAAGGHLPREDILKDAFRMYRNGFDSVNGGLAGAPKFPSSLPIRFLLRYFHRYRDPQALQMAVTTLDKMAAGGIYDHIGGGFHRYATDHAWQVPHFEKMLYDNALLVMDYLEGYQVTGNFVYRQVVEEILEYVRRDMTSPEGGFFSATDADSITPEGHREEGYYFTWTPAELRKVLGRERFPLVNAYYTVGSEPNFEGRHILHTARSMTETAAEFKLDTDVLRQALESAKADLRHARSQRPQPLRDEKILTAWNGLMISAFARAGLVLDNPAYTRQAVRAATFVRSHLYREGRLLRSYKDGSGRHSAFLEDYAFVTAGFIDLFEATQALQWIELALEMEKTLADQFEDAAEGGYFATANDHEPMIAREKPNYDGAVPSGNSVAVMNLLRLGALTANHDYRRRARKALKSLAAVWSSHSTALSEMLLAIDFYLDHPKEIVIVTPEGKTETAHVLLNRLRKTFVPNRCLVVASQGRDLRQKSRMLPLVRDRSAIENSATAYICQNSTCSIPTSDPDAFEKQLRT